MTLAEPQNITRFAIDPRVVALSRESLMIGDTKVALPAPVAGADRPLLFEKRDGEWTCPGVLDAASLTGKRPGLQGPIDDAFARPFLCVRGTGQAWNSRVAAWANANLKRFADEWRRHYRGELPVKNDTEVTDDDVQRCNRVALEARLAGRVDQVDLPLVPLEVAERVRDGHLALLLVLVPVGDRGALLDDAEPVRRAGLEEHRLDE